jgi:dihydroflavonol-4-reductase
MSSKFFLVTGGSGYIAIHIINNLVRKGYRVRTTVRNVKLAEKVEPIKKLNKHAKFPIEIVQADLLDSKSWPPALKDITHVMHVASPLLLTEPKNEDLEYIQPAVQGTLNILQACASPESTVERVVITSSGLCIFGSEFENRTYSEEDWADFDKLKTGYIRSKLLAEEAAWKFVKNKKDANEACFELAVVHPVLVLGPLLHTSLGTSATRFLNVFANKLEKIPDLYYPTCDVRG